MWEVWGHRGLGKKGRGSGQPHETSLKTQDGVNMTAKVTTKCYLGRHLPWSECLCPPKTYMLKSRPPKMMVLGSGACGRCLSHEVVPLRMRLVPDKRGSRKIPTSFHHVRTERR